MFRASEAGARGRKVNGVKALCAASAALNSRRAELLLSTDPGRARSAARQAMADDPLNLRAAELLLLSQ